LSGRVRDPPAASNDTINFIGDDGGDGVDDDAASRAARQALEPRKPTPQSAPQKLKLRSTPAEMQKTFCARCS